MVGPQVMDFNTHGRKIGMIGTPWLRKLFMVAQSFLTLSPLLWLSLYPYIPFYPFRFIDMAQLKGWTMSNPNSTPILNSQTGWIYIKWFESPSGKLTYLWNIANVLLSIYYLRWWFSTFPVPRIQKRSVNHVSLGHPYQTLRIYQRGTIFSENLEIWEYLI